MVQRIDGGTERLCGMTVCRLFLSPSFHVLSHFLCSPQYRDLYFHIRGNVRSPSCLQLIAAIHSRPPALESSGINVIVAFRNPQPVHRIHCVHNVLGRFVEQFVFVVPSCPIGECCQSLVGYHDDPYVSDSCPGLPRAVGRHASPTGFSGRKDNNNNNSIRRRIGLCQQILVVVGGETVHRVASCSHHAGSVVVVDSVGHSGSIPECCSEPHRMGIRNTTGVYSACSVFNQVGGSNSMGSVDFGFRYPCRFVWNIPESPGSVGIGT